MKNVTYINASAGSGKTYTLTHLLAQLIKDKEVKPEQIIMTTFSVKAANEMKEEAKKVLYESSQFDEATRIDQAMIGTIHGVAQAFIKKYWFFLGLSPDMGVMDENDTNFYVSQSLSDLPSDADLRILHAFCEDFDIQVRWGSDKSGVDYDFWKEDIKAVINYTTNYEIENYKRSCQESLDYIRQFVDNNVKDKFTEQELADALKEFETFISSKGESNENEKRKTTLNALKRGVKKPSIAWYAKTYDLLKKLKNMPPKSTQLRDELSTLWHWPAVYERQKEYIELLFNLAAKWKEGYSNYKKEKNLLDFNDMEKYLRDLLNDERVSKEIAEDYRYLFVDEYQDCSPIQVKIFDRLSDLMKHSYWVGDYKQAIYGFRGSDITLSKAMVDRIATGKDGCKMAVPLDTSYRSLPDIVNVCNNTFEKTFEGVLDRNSIVLKEHRKNESGITSLRYWKLPSATGEKPKANEHKVAQRVGLARHIAHLIKDEGALPNEIAVLNRKNEPMDGLAGELKALDIPASRENMPVLDMQAAPLVMALLSLIASDSDSLAKAQIAYLTEENTDTRAIIEQRLVYDIEKDKNLHHFLDDVPLVQRMLQLRPMLKQQSLAAQVETMVIELDLYNVVKKIGYASESMSCLNAIIKAAKAYEQHCQQMALPATASGFKDYLAVAKPAGVGDANGVQLHTFHSSKGLQWKYVILTSLQSKVDDPKDCVKSSIYGVHFNYTEHPSAENPYPEVYIRVMPWIYGSRISNVDENIEQIIEESELFKEVKTNSLSESNRLMYVGMTRPQDVMVLALERPAKNCHELQWLKEIGLESVNPQAESDLLGVGSQFKNDTLSSQQLEEMGNFRYKSMDEKLNTNRIPYQQPLCEASRKYVSPSSLHENGELVEHYDICERMNTGSLVGRTMADAGDCIHQIYCGIETHIDDESYYRNLIESYGVKTYLTDVKAIRAAWESLTSWLTEMFGSATNVYHERPFTLMREGQVLTGSIDLVWQTKDGDILIDFKTCPMGKDAILNSDSEHYAGWYAGQLDAYTDALEAAGEKVIKRFIYYPISGMVCEIGRVPKTPQIIVFSNVYCFDASNSFDINKMIEGAAKVLDTTIMFGVYDPDEEEIQRTLMYIKGGSTQGVETILLKSGMFTINLPYLASRADVALAFALMREAKKIRPELVIYEGDEKTFADLSEDKEVHTYFDRLDNMANIIEQQNDHIGVNGIMHEFHIYPEYIKTQMPDGKPEDWTYKAFKDFIDIQWNYEDYESFSRATIGTPDDDEFTARILGNTKGFAGVCQKVILFNGKENKIVDIDNFFEATKHNKYIKRLDYAQFVIDEMPKKEWEAFYDSFDVKPIRKPKTYLLRWNPSISSFKLETYRKATTECPDGFGFDWSIYEWEDAHEKDRYFMLRTGDENAGIVWHGIFTSDPYEDEDWAGQGKQRHYMKMDCYDCVPADQKPPIDIELLEKEIPEIDWRKGHSGQLLSEEVADKLNELWKIYNPYID